MMSFMWVLIAMSSATRTRLASGLCDWPNITMDDSLDLGQWMNHHEYTTTGNRPWWALVYPPGCLTPGCERSYPFCMALLLLTSVLGAQSFS
jgi:hypothetical protein